ncbi:MAG TPA: 6-bladed beta-propeller [Longimicrobium sp.]
MLIALLPLLGCDAETGGRDDASFIVRNRPPGEWDTTDRWRLVEEVRIGGGASGGPSAFGRVVGVALDSLARVWVADELQHQISVFEPDGRHVRSIGRKGAGPAEFQRIAGMRWGPDGNLWVLDAGNSRFAVYDTAGKLVTTRSRAGNASVSPWPGGFDNQGRLYDLGSRHQQGETSVTTLARVNVSTGAADTLKLPPFRQMFFGSITRSDGPNKRTNQAPVPFTGTQVWAVDPRGYAWFASTDRYRVERLSAHGAPDRVIELENRAVPVTRQDKARILENYAWFEQQGGKLDPSLIPNTQPHLLGFFFDDAGNLWVQPTYPAGRNTPLDVFDADGTYQGRIEGPLRLLSRPAPAIRGNRMAAVMGNADDVHSVAVFRIVKPGR